MIEVWNTILLEPMLNVLVLLAKLMFSSFGMSIIALTIIVRILTLPLTLKQLRSQKQMQAMQPRIVELKKKFAKDRQRMAQETMKLYKEHGVSPLGGCLPMVVQFPIWIALYQSIVQALSVTPEGLLGLSQRLYSWSTVQGAVPLQSGFLWMDLAVPNIFMAVLAAVSTYVWQKMMVMPDADPSQQSMSRMMTWMMPLMIGFFSLSFPSGLSLYWVLSNVISIVLQYKVTGWGTLSMPAFRLPTSFPRPTAKTPAAKEDTSAPALSEPGVDVVDSEGEKREDRRAVLEQKRIEHGKHRDKRQVRGRGRRSRPR